MTGYVVSFRVPRYSPSVNVSLEPTCCDGSDEPAGICENTCVAAGRLYRQKQEAVRKLHSTVSVEKGLTSHSPNKIFRALKSVRHILHSHGKRMHG
jgi:hypothetical protein